MSDWKTHKASGFKATLAYLDALYERYFWSIPASTIDLIPDNSLYEHSKTSAAIAGAMYLHHQETDTMELGAIKDRDKEKFIFVAGDISGIQNYIFAIAHAGAGKVAKRLRARSFLLNQLIQILAFQIIDDVGLPFINIILSAGGKFYLLLPNTERVKEILLSRELDSQKWLQKSFQGLLNLNLSWLPLNGKDFTNKKIVDKFSELSGALEYKKYQPLKTLLSKDGNWNNDLFIMPESMVTEESFSGQYDIKGPLTDKEEEDLGRELTKAKCIAIHKSDQGKYNVLGWSFSVSDNPQAFNQDAHCLVSFKRHIEDQYPNPKVPVHYEYRASHVPAENGQILPFDQLAEKSSGRKTIAYLKADVDNLGLLLRNGLNWHPNGWTLSKMATFSRSLEFFFSGRIENIIKQDFNSIYTVFSGGDDVLLVGPWDTIHDFARRLQEEWQDFTGYNDDLTLSIGITLCRPLMPVWAASSAADHALEKAKSGIAYPGRNKKNQLCSFDHLIKWDEVDFVFDNIEMIDQWLSNGLISTAFVRNLLYYAQLAKMYREDNLIEGLRYLPLLSYNISRNIKRQDQDVVCRWAEDLKNYDGDLIRHLMFIANYSLNLNRG